MAGSAPDIDIESLIPHRDRIRVICEVLEITDETAVVSALVKSTWPLCDGAAVDPLVLIEVVAQAAAVIDGSKRRKQGKAGGKGWLVGVKSALFNVTEIPVGTELVARVSNSYSFDNYSVIQGSVESGEKKLAEIILQALRMNEDPTVD
jgi:predicted hotdog family 3-hydroxylacyl-ACP dehydratase